MRLREVSDSGVRKQSDFPDFENRYSNLYLRIKLNMINGSLEKEFQFYILEISSIVDLSDEKHIIFGNGENELQREDSSKVSGLHFHIRKLTANEYSLKILKQQSKRLKFRWLNIYFEKDSNEINMKKVKDYFDATIGACDQVSVTLVCKRPYVNWIFKQIQGFENITKLNLKEVHHRKIFLTNFVLWFLKGDSRIETLSLFNANVFLPLCKTLRDKETVRNLKKIRIFCYGEKDQLSLLNALNMMRFSSLNDIDLEVHNFRYQIGSSLPFSYLFLSSLFKVVDSKCINVNLACPYGTALQHLVSGIVFSLDKINKGSTIYIRPDLISLHPVHIKRRLQNWKPDLNKTFSLIQNLRSVSYRSYDLKFHFS
eukprot:maker-scaffold_25-snap-gene-5.58-mRNA-1 protein AED:0.06 eAED:0.09 QI:0/0/0.5/1/0/0/2/79/369